MIGLFAAAVIAQATPQRLSTWSQMADELEATGKIDCPLNPDESRRAKETSKRIISFPEPTLPYAPINGDLRQDNECVVMEVVVGRAGVFKAAQVLRYKGRPGENAASWGMRVIRGVRFQPQPRDWKGLVVYSSGFDSDEIPEIVQIWRERDVAISGK